MRATRFRFLLMSALIGALAALPAAAKKSSPDIPLAYRPTTTVAAAQSTPTSEMRAVAAALLVTDNRGGDAGAIGTRSDEKDRRIDLRSTVDIPTFVQDAFAKQATEWGFHFGPAETAELLLVGKLDKLWLEESNQAVGASYSADVTLKFELRDRGGKNLWSGTFFGDASRYGKKYSLDNSNEVVSDALAEAFAGALGNPALRRVWAATRDALASAQPPPTSPEALLEAIGDRLASGADETAVAEFVRTQTLSRALGSDDLAAWRGAGVPEAAVRAAMALTVRSEGMR